MKKTNWLNVTNRINSDRFQIPAGWETKEQVAESLQCDPKRVADLLKPGIESGHIERKQFPMWIESRRLVEQVVCYREKPAEAAQPSAKVKTAPDAPESLEARIAAKIRANPGKCDRDISKMFWRHGLRAGDVAKIRAKLA